MGEGLENGSEEWRGRSRLRIHPPPPQLTAPRQASSASCTARAGGAAACQQRGVVASPRRLAPSCMFTIPNSASKRSGSPKELHPEGPCTTPGDGAVDSGRGERRRAHFMSTALPAPAGPWAGHLVTCKLILSCEQGQWRSDTCRSLQPLCREGRGGRRRQRCRTRTVGSAPACAALLCDFSGSQNILRLRVELAMSKRPACRLRPWGAGEAPAPALRALAKAAPAWVPRWRGLGRFRATLAAELLPALRFQRPTRVLVLRALTARSRLAFPLSDLSPSMHTVRCGSARSNSRGGPRHRAPSPPEAAHRRLAAAPPLPSTHLSPTPSPPCRHHA